MSNAAVNAEADALAEQASGGYMRWYDGIQPATSDTAITTQNVVAELRFGTPAFGPAVAGIITATPITPDPAAPGGEAAWFRNFAADGVTPQSGVRAFGELRGSGADAGDRTREL